MNCGFIICSFCWSFARYWYYSLAFMDINGESIKATNVMKGVLRSDHKIRSLPPHFKVRQLPLWKSYAAYSV